MCSLDGEEKRAVPSPGKRKGDHAELEAQALCRELGFEDARRALGAGRPDDVGDMDRIPLTALQVAHRENLTGTITTKLTEVERQRRNRRVPFSAVFIRRSRVREHKWIVVLTPEMWAKLLKYAVVGYRIERKRLRAVTSNEDRGKLSGHGNPRSTAGPASHRERTGDRAGSRSRSTEQQRSGDGGKDRRRVRGR